MWYDRVTTSSPTCTQEILCAACQRSRVLNASRSRTSRCATRPALAALRVREFSKRNVMVVQTLLWPDEVRDPDFPSLDADVEVRAPELKMAGQVVESMAGTSVRGVHRHLPGVRGTCRSETSRRRGLRH